MASQYLIYPPNTSTSGPVSFTRNGGTQIVTEDTVTPANNRPLPTEITGPNGPVTTTVGGGKTQLDVNIAGASGAPINENLVQVGGAAIALGQTTMAASLPVAIASNQTAVPENLTQVGGSAIAIGQAAMAASLPVVLASNQTSIPVTQGTSPWVENVSQFGGSNVVTGTGASGAGIPRVTISNDSSLAANQSVNLTQVGGSAITLGQKTSANSVPTVLASDQSAIPVSQSGTWTVQPGNTANTTPWLATINQGGNSATVTAGNALKVDGSAVTQPISQAGRSKVAIVRNDYSSVNVTTGAYVQLIASTAATINQLDIFDSSGQTLALATGAAASEVNQIYIYPGGNGIVELLIAAGTRVSIIAISGTASTGEIDINFLS